MRNKIFFFWILSSFLVFACKEKTNHSTTEHKQNIESKAPNIILILIDDAGYVDFGFMGSKDLETPHIDALAADGVVFTDAHVSSTVCAPSRAGLITGQYQQRFGFEANGTGDEDSGDIGLAKNLNTIADVFQQNNYNTVAIGKWHLGAKEYNHPNQRGFQDFYGFLAGGRSYFPLENPSEALMLQHNGEKVNFDGYLTDVLGDYSVQYAEENKNNPFFMYLSYNAVHTPMEAKQVHLEKYKNHSRKELAAMTWSLDENIGKLRSKLKEQNILDNTLIYFLSDNGGAHNNQSSSGKLKGWKGNEFEGGHRVPFIVSWPDKIEKGWKFNGLTSSLDIFQTSLAAAGIQPKKDMRLDGENLIPFLTKQKVGNPHKTLHWRKLEESATRINNFKMVRLDGNGSVLYNLDKDLGETKDISVENKEKFNQLTQEYKNWEDKMMKPLWSEPKNWMEVTYHIHQQLMQNESAHYQSPSEMKVFLEEKKE